MRKSAFVTFIALALAGCDGGSSEPTKVQSIRVGADNPYHDQMLALTDMNRALALRRAVQDSGKRCKRADASAFQGDYKTFKLWTLRCSDSGDWAIFLSSNGDVQVRACKDMTQLGLPPCVVGTLEPQDKV